MAKIFEKHLAKVTSLSHDGRGIAHINKKTTFIFGALPGEEVEFRYTKMHSQYDEGSILEVLQAADSRVKPRCEFFGICGGCSLQHVNPRVQLEHKETVLMERLEHIANAKPLEMMPVLHDEIWGYRHRARLSVHYRSHKNKVVVGFREQNSHLVADISHCDVLAPVIGDKISALSSMLSSLSVKAQIPQIEIAVTPKITALVIRHLAPLKEEDFFLIEKFADENQFYLYLQPKGNQSIYLHYPKKEGVSLEYEIPNHRVRIQFQPLQFTQINPNINLKMIDLAIQLLEPTQKDHILDLFCGIGNFTLPLARYCESVVGIEGDHHSVLQAKKNTGLNDIKNAEFFTANLFDKCEDAPWAGRRYDKLLLDPPRAGAKEIIPLIKHFQPSRIVYVSCHSATLARDIKTLLELGYTLEKAGMMDMFPHTQHAEAIALLTKKT